MSDIPTDVILGMRDVILKAMDNRTNIKPILRDINGASFIGISTVTIPKLKGGKKNPFKGHVKKITEGSSVMIFQNKKKNGYEAMIKRRLEQEGKDPNSFILRPRAWGERIPNTPIVHHNGNYYLEVIFLRPGKTHYEVDGVKTNPEDIEGLVIDHTEREVDYSIQGGLYNKVIIRTFRLDNISKFKFGGNTYTNLKYSE
jgi:hypothetical protein